MLALTTVVWFVQLNVCQDATEDSGISAGNEAAPSASGEPELAASILRTGSLEAVDSNQEANGTCSDEVTSPLTPAGAEAAAQPTAAPQGETAGAASTSCHSAEHLERSNGGSPNPTGSHTDAGTQHVISSAGPGMSGRSGHSDPSPAARLGVGDKEAAKTGMAVTWLGTSSGAPTLKRNVSCISLRLPNSTFLVDSGEGSCRQVG